MTQTLAPQVDRPAAAPVSPGRGGVAIPRQTQTGGAPASQPKSAPRKPRRKTGRRFQNWLTVIIGLVAAGAAVTGMWAFFGDVFHITEPAIRIAFCAVFEMCMLVSALRARTALLKAAEQKDPKIRAEKRRSAMPDQIAVWVFAGTSGALSALDADTNAARLGRFVLPLVAAWMFERAINADADDRALETGGTPKTRRWRLSPERILVRLGLIDPSGRDVDEIDRTRKIARLAILAYRAGTARHGLMFKDRARNKALRRYEAALEKAHQEYGLASNVQLMKDLKAGIALLHNARKSITPEAVEGVDPWGTGRRPAAPASATAPTRTAPAAGPRTRTSTVRVTPQAARNPVDTALAFAALQQAEPGLTQSEYAVRLGYGGTDPARGLRKALDKALTSTP